VPRSGPAQDGVLSILVPAYVLAVTGRVFPLGGTRRDPLVDALLLGTPIEASGWAFGAIALAGALGAVLGGFFAEAFGFNSINWMAAIAAAGAVILMLVASHTKR
jgi:MFS family permease